MTEDRDSDPEGRPRPAVPEKLRPSPGVRPGTRDTGAQSNVATSSRPVAPPQPAPGGSRPPVARGPRRARLTLRRVDPWSVLKLTLVFTTALLVVFVVAVFVLYLVLEGMGVFDSVTSFMRDISPGSKSASDIASLGRVVGGAAVIGAINVVLVTALATLGAFVYNLCADLVGGIDVTLTERE